MSICCWSYDSVLGSKLSKLPLQLGWEVAKPDIWFFGDFSTVTAFTRELKRSASLQTNFFHLVVGHTKMVRQLVEYDVTDFLLQSVFVRTVTLF
jgi:hypothetical protein